MQIKIGTRGSQLALTQTALVEAALQQRFSDLSVFIQEIKTLGDRKQDTAAASVSDKKEWVVDLEMALVAKEIDLAVHSGKDVPAELEPGTKLIPVLTRANPFDVFIGKLRPQDSSNSRLKFIDLPQGAVVGTASHRRREALVALRPDLNVIEHRGNVPTRISKLDNSDELSGIVLAAAGVDRLGLQTEVFYESFDAQSMLPGINQGILAVQLRADDSVTERYILALTDPDTLAAFWAERSCAELLEGDCNSAIGIYANHGERDVLQLSCTVYDRSSAKNHIYVSENGSTSNPHELGHRVARKLLDRGAKELLNYSKTLGK